MKTRAYFFPFDLFGSSGTKEGVELLADGIREMIDDNKREKIPTRARAYQNKMITEEVQFETLEDYHDWRSVARQEIQSCLESRDFLLWVSGNHLGVLPAYEALGSLKKPPLVIQLDAHLDIYHLSDCTSELSHGNFLLHAEGKLPPMINLGHRELLLKPDYIAQHFTNVFAAADLTIDPTPALARLQTLSRAAGGVFLDLDCDVFDVAYFPAISQPQPFGLNPSFLLRVLEAIADVPFLGFAISEFYPARDENDRSLATLLWLVEYVLLHLYEGR